MVQSTNIASITNLPKLIIGGCPQHHPKVTVCNLGLPKVKSN